MTVAAAAAPAYAAADVHDAAGIARVLERLRPLGVRLEPDELPRLAELLERPPSLAEAVLFGILWSEHCSYKSTRHLLRRLPTRAPQVVIGPGEDAGVVALPAPCDDQVLVLAHESHNHPSQVLPVEGAATGVGGIVRDVACMGAEVIGVLDALRFGDPRSGVAVRDVVRGVVQGIADYGNPLGVPNVGGDVGFDAAFDANVLVNVMAVGVAPRNGIVRSRVPGLPGASSSSASHVSSSSASNASASSDVSGADPRVFVLVGKPTDESGFGGAAFASAALTDADDRGAVQRPDPFLERVLLVAHAEALARIRARGIPAGMKDLGAGGVACATAELAAAAGCGAEVALDAAPRVARDIRPEVLLCAETQERFCWAVPASFAAELCAIYDREFDLAGIHPGAAARVIGRATPEPRYRVTWHGETVVDCAIAAITEGRRIDRPARRRAVVAVAPSPPQRGRGAPPLREALFDVLRSLDGCSREYLVRHYDGEVQGRTWRRRGEADAAVIQPDPRQPLGVAFAVAGNARWCAADPEQGAAHAVAEAARRVACVGARPWALTDCLNFGDPACPEVMGDVEASLDGLARAAAALGGLASPGHPLPFVSGNVSLHNHTSGRSIPPAPIVLCAGVLERVDRAVGWALVADRTLVRIGTGAPTLAGSLWARIARLGWAASVPALDLEAEARLQALVAHASAMGRVTAAHAIGAGGTLGAIVDLLLASAPRLRLGAELVTPEHTDASLAWFAESPAVVCAAPLTAATDLLRAAADAGLAAGVVGHTDTSGAMRVRGDARPLGTLVELAAARDTTLARLWNEEPLP